MKNKTTITALIFSSMIIAIAVLFLSGCGIGTRDTLPEPALTVSSTEIVAEPMLVLPTETPVVQKEEISISPLDIEALRARDYPASELTIEEMLDPGTNYQRFIASYISDGSGSTGC